MKKQIFLAIFIGCCFVASYAQNDGGSQITTGKISFAEGKAKPSFENVEKLIGIMENNKNLALQVSVPRCKNKYSEKLINKRVRNLSDYFVSSGIDKSRVSVIVEDVEKNGEACDCVSMRVMTAETQEKVYEETKSLPLSKTVITFRKKSDRPRIQGGDGNINKTVDILKANPALKLIVECTANDYKSERDNRDLAIRRSDNVRDIFIQKGVDSKQIETVFFSANDPRIQQNNTKQGGKKHGAVVFSTSQKIGAAVLCGC